MNFVTTLFELIKCLVQRRYSVLSSVKHLSCKFMVALTRQKYFSRWNSQQVNLWDFKIPPQSIERVYDTKLIFTYFLYSNKFPLNCLHKFEEKCKVSRLSINKTKQTDSPGYKEGMKPNDVQMKFVRKVTLSTVESTLWQLPPQNVKKNW